MSDPNLVPTLIFLAVLGVVGLILLCHWSRSASARPKGSPRAAGKRPRARHTYLIILESKTQADVDRLNNLVRGFLLWAQPTETSWIVRTPMTLEDLSETIEREITAEARFFVTESSGTATWRRVRCSAEWLHTNL